MERYIETTEKIFTIKDIERAYDLGVKDARHLDRKEWKGYTNYCVTPEIAMRRELSSNRRKFFKELGVSSDQYDNKFMKCFEEKWNEELYEWVKKK